MGTASQESWVVTGPQVIEVEDVRSLRVAISGGRVDVVGRDEPGVRLEVHAVSGRPLEVGLVDGQLRLGYAFSLGGWDRWFDKILARRSTDSVDVHLAVPRWLETRVAAVGAEVFLGDLVQGAQVSTVAGGVVVDGTQGVLTVRTVSGDLVVRGHTGDLRAETVSGALTATGAFTQVSAVTVSGDVVLDATRIAGLNVQTAVGDATLRLPEGLGLTVAARGVSGRVVVDGEVRGDGPLTGAVDVVTGDGACRVSATTVSGDLTILRSMATPATQPAEL
jgi:hypothetical protein